MGLLWACKGSDLPPPMAEPPPIEVEAPPPEPPPLVWLEYYRSSQIIVAWAGADGAPVSVTRTEAEAKVRAEALRERVLAGENFATLAQSESDGTDAGRNGKMGGWRHGTLDPAVEEAVARADIGGIGPLAKTAFGYVIVRREVVETLHLGEIVVPYIGASAAQHPRTEAAAKLRAEEALTKLTAGENFSAVATAFSDAPSNLSGGDLGIVGRGQLTVVLEDAAFALPPGGTSALIQTPTAFIIVHRLD